MPDTAPCSDLETQHKQALADLDKTLTAAEAAKEEWDEAIAETDEASGTAWGLGTVPKVLGCVSTPIGWVGCGAAWVFGTSVTSISESLHRIEVADAKSRYYQADSAFWNADIAFSRATVALAKCLNCEMVKVQRGS